jgi:hypothetical protein
VNHADLVELWGSHRVVRFDDQELRGVPIPEAARRFLSEVGLPWRIAHAFTVEVGVDLEDANDAPRDRLRAFTVHPSERGEALRIGWDYGGELCVLGSGEVWSLPRGGVGRSLFVNSSVDRFVESLYLFSQARASQGMSEDEVERPGTEFADHAPDEEITAYYLKLASRLRDLDPSAWRHNNWWPQVLEGEWMPLVSEPGWPTTEMDA